MNQRSYLNGLWDFMPLYGVEACLDLPEALCYERQKIQVPSSWRWKTPTGFGVVEEFEPYNIFGYPEEWGNADTGVLHRTFTVPDSMAGQKIYLCLEGVGQRARVFVNGVLAAEWAEIFLPLKADITGLVKRQEENDLTVVCTSFEKEEIPSGDIKCLGLAGSWYGSNMAKGLWNDVYLESAPYVRLEDASIRTSVRRWTLEALFSAVNETGESRQLSVLCRVMDGETCVKEFASQPIAVAPGATAAFDLTEPWEDPQLWDTDHPFLYTLCTELREGDAALHQREDRFGFREFWNEGPNFILNGTRINLRGDSWHFQGAVQMTKQYALNWYAMCKESGVNYVRLHAEPHPECYLEAADEAGMLLVDESAIYGSGKTMPAGHPVFIQRCRDHIRRLVARDKNHPSVVIWSLQNEMRWVDGRDEYKQFIPEFLELFNALDPTRKVSLDGDNRLISYENTQLESLHYNIDGTLAQWRQEKPLTIGEHCGLWFICPQNASAYVGMKAYHDVDDSSIGFAAKERLFVEYARRLGVSGISTFNFAHYFMRSMPDEDVPLHFDSLEGPGNKPLMVRKNSLTINNGYLKDYPMYRPNPTMAFMRQAFKPVTIIPAEYNASFFDGAPVERTFDVYNDTRHEQHCTIRYTIRLRSEPVSSGSLTFVQAPGERYEWKLRLPAVDVDEVSCMTLTATLLHGEQIMHVMERSYKMYPSRWKTAPAAAGEHAAYYGGEDSHAILRALLPGCRRLDSLGDIPADVTLLVLGDNLDDCAADRQDSLRAFVRAGGVLVQLEQYDFAMGDLMLQRQPFFSAYTSTPEHPVLRGLTDADFIFWHPDVVEERPRPFISQNFVKPEKGDLTFILESSAGDYADGGDLWSPLVEYGYEKGDMLFCQLEVAKNFNTVPQACVLLRNLLAYADSRRTKPACAVGALAGDEALAFLRKTGLKFEPAGEELSRYGLVVAQAAALTGDRAQAAARYLSDGGTLLLLPFTPEESPAVSALVGGEVACRPCPVYHLEKTVENGAVFGISNTDLFRYDKVPMSPRLVTNTLIARHTVEAAGAKALLKDVTGTPWYDYYQNNYNMEFARIALVSINAEEKRPEQTFLAELPVGKGRALLSQISTDAANEKDLRIYSRLLSNLGAYLEGNVFSYRKTDRDYAVDFFMTLPVLPYQDYETVRAYYTDPQYSLNNLGEGLYGWMLKVEKNRADGGTIRVPKSAGQTLFLTCFVDYPGDGHGTECQVELESNGSAQLWFNGEKAGSLASLPMLDGVNRVVVDAKAGEEDFCMRMIFKDGNGVPMKNLLYHLTIDEVDPK